MKHPFTHYGDYDRAARALHMNATTIRGYAKDYGLNNDMPGPRTGTVHNDNGTPLSVRVRQYLAHHRCTVTELADVFEVPPKAIHGAIAELTEQAVALDEEDGVYCVAKDIRRNDEPVHESLETLGARQGRFLVGATADWHVGSKYARKDVIDGLYAWYKAEGATSVYVAGNWIDGEARFNMFDLDVHGMTAQVQRFLEWCPKVEGITTKVLSGDDHEGWYVQREGVNIGQLLEMEAQRAGREDIKDIGYMERDIELVPTQVLRIIHAGGGSTYATSYTAQKYVESLQGGQKPRIVVMGHYHKLSFEYPREVYVLQPGCAQDQTPFERKNKIQAHVGGCILDIRVNDDGIIDEVGCRFKTWFDRKFYEYKW